MYALIPQITFFASLAVVVYLFARAVPRVDDFQDRSFVRKFESIIDKIPLETIDKKINIFLEKTLRKIKVIILRIDNKVSETLEKMRHMKSSSHSAEGEDGYIFDKMDSLVDNEED